MPGSPLDWDRVHEEDLVRRRESRSILNNSTAVDTQGTYAPVTLRRSDFFRLGLHFGTNKGCNRRLAKHLFFTKAEFNRLAETNPTLFFLLVCLAHEIIGYAADYPTWLADSE